MRKGIPKQFKEQVILFTISTMNRNISSLDKLLLELMRGVDLHILYRNLEFKQKLISRSGYYGRKHKRLKIGNRFITTIEV